MEPAMLHWMYWGGLGQVLSGFSAEFIDAFAQLKELCSPGRENAREINNGVYCVN
jgi:hypothetical protein